MARRAPYKKSSCVFVIKKDSGGRCPPLLESKATRNGDDVDLLRRFDLFEGITGEETLEVMAFELDEHVRL